MRAPIDFDPGWIVHEDEDLIVADKPAGMPSQAAEEGHDDDLPTRLRRFLAARDGRALDELYLGIHQRLDRDTSGLVLFTKRREANAAVAAQLEGRTVDKRYVAIVSRGERLPEAATLEHRLARADGGRMRVVDARERDGQDAVTKLRVVERQQGRAQVELELLTGRTHQLRVQLEAAGASIAGDPWYGGDPALRLMLHAEWLSLSHPADGRRLALHAPPPPELARFLAHGEEDACGDDELFERALALAMEQRFRLFQARTAGEPTTAFRLLHRRGDGVPGLAVDVYGEYLVANFFDAPDVERDARVLDALQRLSPRGIYLKRHPRQKNELGEARGGELAPEAPVRGEPAEDELVVYEHGLPLGVRLADGLRTGLFLDQRDNRRRVRAIASGLSVLNLFAYTGGFSAAALAGGAASAVCVDASARALSWSRRNVERVGGSARHRVLKDDVFDVLRRMARRGERFDLVVVDPPSYSTTRSRRMRVLDDYAELCAAAMRVMAPRGRLLACINHHAARQGQLRDAVRAAAGLSGRALASLRDTPPQRDFPAPAGHEPDAKSVAATLAG
jgi:23S rRNA (cytosine1962-C5)-methyltransferase